MTFKNETQVWNAVEKRVNRSVSDAVRNNRYIVAEVEACLAGDYDEELFNFFVEKVRELCNLESGQHSRRGRSADDNPDAYTYAPTEAERNVSDALRNYVVTVTAWRKDVRAFRFRLRKITTPSLRSALANEDAAYLLQNNEICRFLSFKQARDWDVPLDTPYIQVSWDGNYTYDQMLRGEPAQLAQTPRFRYTLTAKVEGESGPRWKQTQVEFEQWESIALARINEESFSRVMRHPFALLQPDGAAVWHQAGWGWNHGVFANDGASSKIPVTTFTPTIAGQALNIAAQLAHDFALEPENALTLLITGVLPSHSPLQARYGGRLAYNEKGKPDYIAHGPITLIVEPHVSADSVRKAYHAIQKQVFDGRDRRLNGKEKLHWFGFATRRRKEKRMSWPEMLRQWMESGKASVSADWRAAKRDYGVVKRCLLPLSYWATTFKYPYSPTLAQEETKRRKALFDKTKPRKNPVIERDAQYITGTPPPPPPDPLPEEETDGKYIIWTSEDINAKAEEIRQKRG